MDKNAGWKDTGLSALIGSGAGGALGAGYGALEGEGHTGRRALEGAGIGGLAGLGAGAGKAVAEKMEQKRLADALATIRGAVGQTNTLGNSISGRLRTLPWAQQGMGGPEGLDEMAKLVQSIGKPQGQRVSTGNKGRMFGGAVGATAGIGGLTAEKRHSSKKAAYELGVKLAFLQFGL